VEGRGVRLSTLFDPNDVKIQPRSSRRNAWLGGLAAAVIATAVFTGSALAFYGGTAAGRGRATAGVLHAPNELTTKPGAGTVELSWNAVPAPIGGSVAYYVSRDGTPAGGPCGDPTAPTGDTSCTDSGLSKGSYDYTVTAVWRSWTATIADAAPVTLASGAAARIVLSGSTEDLASGSTRELTATIEDDAGNTVTSGPESDIEIEFSQASGSGSVAGLGSALAAAGTATASITGVLAGPVGLTATATLNGPGATVSSVLGFTVTPGAPDPAESTLTPVTSSIVADGAATQVLTVQAKDANGNDEASGGATVSVARSSGAGTIGPVTDNGDGTYDATVTAPTATGSGTFVATIDGSPVESGSAVQSHAQVSYVAGPAAGVVLSNETIHPSPDVICSGEMGSVVCSSYGEGNGEQTEKTLTASLTLVDRLGHPVTNTGPGIGIDLAASGEGSVDPLGLGALTIPMGSATTSAPFTATRQSGNGKTLSLVATVHGTSQTLTIDLSSGLPFAPGGETSGERCRCSRFGFSSPRTTSRSSTP
jgi:hypothetical protein